MKNKILILGASGLIGRYLFKFLKEKKKDVIGTYCNHAFEGGVYFNVLESSLDNLNLEEVGYVIICSAIAKIDKCSDEEAKKININGLKRIIKEFSERKIIPVFISGSVVFNGNGNYAEEDLRNPVNRYGFQKKEVEDFIFNEIDKYLIIRLGKIFGIEKGEGYFSELYERYLNNEDIRCAEDDKLSLTCAEDIAKAISWLMDNESKGIYHIDSGIVKNRYDFAKEFFDFLGIDVEIKKCLLDDFKFSEPRAKNQFLDSSKFVRESEFEFKDLEKSFKEIKLRISSLHC